jgi:hypothetical protein
VPVRAEMARVLGLLGAGDRRVPAALERLLAGEKEPQVAGSAAAALAALGAVHPPGGAALDHQRGWSCEGGGCAPPPGGATLPIAARAGEALWLVAAPGATGALELGGARVDLVAEQRAYLVRVGASGRLALRPLDGTPHLAAVVRPGRP